jgi:hypothetical protein
MFLTALIFSNGNLNLNLSGVLRRVVRPEKTIHESYKVLIFQI